MKSTKAAPMAVWAQRTTVVQGCGLTCTQRSWRHPQTLLGVPASELHKPCEEAGGGYNILNAGCVRKATRPVPRVLHRAVSSSDAQPHQTCNSRLIHIRGAFA
jgi:hypothetical protein